MQCEGTIARTRSRWTASLLALSASLVALLAALYWNSPLPADNPILLVLVDLFGEPLFLGPLLLGAFVVLAGLILAFKTGGMALTACKYLLGIALLIVVIRPYWSYDGPAGQHLGLVTALEKPFHIVPLLLAILTGMTAVLITFLRWYLLVRAQDLPFTVPAAMRLGMIGFYLSTFLPGSVGGDIFKAAYLAREQSRRTVAVATVLIDRAIGLTGLFWLVALLGSYFWVTGSITAFASNQEAVATLEFIVKMALGLFASSLVFWFLLGILPQRRAEIFAGRLTRIPRVGHSLAEFWRAVWMYRCRGRSIGLAMLLAIIGHVGFVTTFYLAASAFSQPKEIPTVQTHFLIVPVGMALQAGCPTPNGVGGGEFAYGELYERAGSTFPQGVLGSLMRRVVDWVLGLAGLVTYLWMRPSLGSMGQNFPEEQLSREDAAALVAADAPARAAGLAPANPKGWPN